jgi:hypothetical protein
MRYLRLLLTLFLLLVICKVSLLFEPWTKEVAPRIVGRTCEISAADLWRNDGEVMTFRATLSMNASARPCGLHDEIVPYLCGGRRKVETFVDVIGGGHAVLTSDERLDCFGVLRVTGEVDLVDLGGPPGTKSSYSGTWVRVHSYHCEEEQ